MAYMSDESMAEQIASLNIQSHSAQSSIDMSEAGSSFSQNLQSSSDFTPPATPDDDNVQVASLNYPQPVFHHFLRTIYPFQSDNSADETVTLPLNQGDVILVHSIHTNGWADGTLLLNGARGWLPTNYCESYDEEYMRGLLQALTKFWGLLQSGVTIDDRIFDGQGFMQGIVAGVRYLLERSNCLRRESPMIVGNDGLRRSRKALLSDLSALVKTGKTLELQRQNTFTMESEPLANETVDQMLLKAFKIVTRGVKFLDEFLNDPRSQDITKRCTTTLLADEPDDYAPSTAPAEVTTFQNSPRGCNAVSRSLSSRSYTSAASSAQTEQQDQTRRLSYRSNVYTPCANSPGLRHSSMHLRRSCLSPDPASGTVEADRTNFVSERLTSAHDSLNSCLAALLDRLNSNSTPQDLFLSIREVIVAGKVLSTVIESLCTQDQQTDSHLNQVREKMYDCISKLVETARQCVRSGDDDALIGPEDHDNIQRSATDFVSVAGQCASEAKSLIDVIGNFEIPPADLGIDASEFGRDDETLANSTAPVVTVIETLPEPAARPPPPPSVPAEEEEKPLPSFPLVVEDTDSTDVPMEGNISMSHFLTSHVHLASQQTTPVQKRHSSISMSHFLSSHVHSTSEQSTPVQEDVTPLEPAMSPVTEQAHIFAREHNISMPSNNFNQSFGMSFSGDAGPEEVRISSRQQSHASNVTTSTYASRLRDSEISIVSQTSTRATTPDLVPYSSARQSTNSSSVNSLAGSQETEIHEAECSVLVKSFADELLFDCDGQVSAGSIEALVERLTIHDSKPDAKFVSAFYLTFRLFTTPEIFAQTLIDRFEYVAENPYIAEPVRLRIYNVFKGWLESHWRNCTDASTLPIIKTFAESRLMTVLPPAGSRLLQLVDKVSHTDVPLVPRLVSSMGKTATSYVSLDSPLPPSQLSKKEVNLLKAWKNGGDEDSPNILDLSPLELARQFTIKEMTIYNNIQPDELLACEWQKKSGSTAINVRAMWTLSNGLVDLVKESILGRGESDPKKRALVIKHWIKIAMECQKLNNYNCLFAIESALFDSSISRLKKTWDLVSEKRKQQLQEFQMIFDTANNKRNLRDRLAGHVPPCMPFMGLYQGDLHFYHIGNPETRKLPNSDKEVVNFAKHLKTAGIISEVQRFQIPYRLQEIPDLQAWIQTQITRVRAVNDGMNEAGIKVKYHERSLVAEPRLQAPEAHGTVSSFGSGSSSNPSSATTTKDKFDIFSWNYAASKEKLSNMHFTSQLHLTDTNKS